VKTVLIELFCLHKSSSMSALIKPVYCLCVLLLACQVLSAQNKFNFDIEDYDPNTKKARGWNGNVVTVDTVNKQSGQRSLMIQKSAQSFGACNYLVKSTFKGKTIKLTAYAKTEDVKDGYAGLWMRIDDGSYAMLELENMGSRGITGTTDWKKYTIELPHHEEEAAGIYIGGLITGTGKLWVDNFEMFADDKPIHLAEAKKIVIPKARLDTAFAVSSGIRSIPVSKQHIDNLTNLGMLWGFIKYHHPAVANGDFNMDAELFRIVVKVIEAKTKSAANAIMEKWVDGFGVPPVCKNCPPVQKDSNTKLLPDYGYIFNKDNFSKSLIAKLEYIKNNRNQGKHFYIEATNVGGPGFRNENTYPKMDPADAGLRLLALYRYWNMIQYFFPYKHLIGEDWNKVLPEFIPAFANASDGTIYQLSCLRLIARVNDTHANIWGQSKVLNDYFGTYYAPVQTRFIEDKLVVTGYYNDTLELTDKLKKGDIITKINNEPVTSLVKKLLPETPASNYETKLRDLPIKLLRGSTPQLQLEVERDGQRQAVSITRLDAKYLNRGIDYNPAPNDSSYKLLNDHIGYVFPGRYKNKQLPAIKELFKNTKGIIVDMRCYPSEFMPFTFGGFLKSKPSPFVKFTGVNIGTPGKFNFFPPLSNGGDSLAYTGKVVVIVNAYSQSQAEYTTMAFQSAPNVTVIGSTTAGADGNISQIFLPGNIGTVISGIGVYYPDGSETQRVGVKIDVPIKPTIKGIKEGRDELLEKAIAIIEGS
jgi:Periplasmic protease